MERFIPRELSWLVWLMLALPSAGLQAESTPEIIMEVLVTAQKRVQSA